MLCCHAPGGACELFGFPLSIAEADLDQRPRVASGLVTKREPTLLHSFYVTSSAQHCMPRVSNDCLWGCHTGSTSFWSVSLDKKLPASCKIGLSQCNMSMSPLGQTSEFYRIQYYSNVLVCSSNMTNYWNRCSIRAMTLLDTIHISGCCSIAVRTSG